MLLNQRISQDPTRADSWAIRGVLLCQLGDYDGAARDLNHSLRLDPSSVHAHRWLGDLHRKLGQYSQAIALCNKAIALDPKDARNYHHRGDVYFAQERIAEAIADFSEATELKPDWPLPLFSRALARSHDDVRDYDGALTDYDSFLRLEHDNHELIAEAHGSRAQVFIELGLYWRAIEDLTEELRLTPDDPVAYRERSFAYKKVGDKVHASKDWEKALEIEEGFGDFDSVSRVDR